MSELTVLDERRGTFRGVHYILKTFTDHEINEHLASLGKSPVERVCYRFLPFYPSDISAVDVVDTLPDGDARCLDAAGDRIAFILNTSGAISRV